MSSILIQDVSKTFETKDGSVQALKHVSLSIETGDIYGIIGMSGAGKSTLVRCMNFLEVPSEGKVLIDGKSLSEFSPKELRKEREKIGMIFQHFNLLMQKNVLENVCFPLYIQGKKKAEARAKALELLEIVGWQTERKHIPHSSPVDRNKEWQSPEPWPPIHRYCSVTKPQALWIPRPHPPYLNFCRTSIRNSESPL